MCSFLWLEMSLVRWFEVSYSYLHTLSNIGQFPIRNNSRVLFASVRCYVTYRRRSLHRKFLNCPRSTDRQYGTLDIINH